MRCRRGIIAGCIVGSVLGLAWFLWCCVISTLPALSPVSLSLAFRPWLGNWESAFVIFLIVVSLGFLAGVCPIEAHSRENI